MTTWTKTYGIVGVSLFLLGVSFVSLNLVTHPGVTAPSGMLGVFLQPIGASCIIGALIRAAGRR